eukprot:GFUD01003364.1.p1 GENE.GFUD01003364.1~~GFUD01003364.1.p1  ORF type:complete len:451 (+),score=133.30 GFUD01003364.1:67-1419(+)
MAAAHSDEEEGIILVSGRFRRKYQILESSSSDEEREEAQTHKKKRKRIKTPQDTDSDEDDFIHTPSGSTNLSENLISKNKKDTNLDSDSCDGNLGSEDNKDIKSQRHRKLETMAMKKNPNYQSTQKNNLDSEESVDVDDHDDDSDASSDNFDEKTRVFKARFSKLCDLPTCNQNHVRNVTKILGVRIYDDNLGKYTGKKRQDGSETHFWICAKHSKFWQDFSDLEEKNEEERSSEEDDFSDTFIDDTNHYESPDSELNESNDYQAILKELSRSTPKDKENKERYIGEHSKYQLEIHTDTNPGLHLQPGVRLRRNMKTARFDKGLKDDRGIKFQDPEYQDTEDILVFGKLVKIFPRTRRVSSFSQSCGLQQCPKKFIKHQTDIIGAMIEGFGRMKLNSRQKPFHICYQHVRDYKNTGGRNEDTSSRVDDIRRKLNFEEADDDDQTYISSDN